MEIVIRTDSAKAQVAMAKYIARILRHNMPKMKPMSALLNSAVNIPVQIGSPKWVTNKAEV